MRRLLASVTLAAISLSLTVPLAAAHYNDDRYARDGHVLDWQNTNNPSPSTTAGDGSQVWVDEVVAAYARFNDGIKSWDVVVRPVNGGQPSSCHEELLRDPQKKNGYPTEVYISCPWNTARATEYTLPGPTSHEDAGKPVSSRVWQSRDLGPAVNGRYTIEITVYNAGQTCGALIAGCEPDKMPVEPHCLAKGGYAPCKPGDPPPQWRSVYVVNDVSAPTDASSVFDPNTNRIGVTWTASPEPDAYYVVQEKVGDGKWSSGVSIPANRYERTIEHSGKYQYQVKAVRPAPTRDNANKTKESSYVGAGAVDVAQITPPTTAGGASSGPDGAPDGGDPGVSNPTDPTSPTPSTAGARGGSPPKGSTSSRPGGSGARPAGSSARATGSTPYEPGEAEGEGIDEGFSPELPYFRGQTDPKFADDEGEGEEAAPQTLAGGVVPKPRDTRQLLIFMASALTLFVFAMQLTVLLRRSRPALAGTAPTEHYHGDFDEWLGF